MFRRNTLRRKPRKTHTRTSRRLSPESLEDRRLLAVYVDGTDVTPDGGGCGSLANPCNTIETGVMEAFTGEEVFVFDGLYGETVSIPKDLELIGVGDVTIDGIVNGIDITGATTDVRIENIDITGSAIGIRGDGISSLQLQDVTSSSNTSDGVFVSGASFVSIQNGTYNLNGSNGITLESLTGDAILAGGDSTLGALSGLSANGNGDYGVDISTSGSVTIFATDMNSNGIDGAVLTSGGINIESSRAKFNSSDGVEIVDSSGIISVDASDLSSNSGSGLNINNMGSGDVVLRDLRAVDNAAKGAAIADVGSVFDTSGVYTDNGSGGLGMLDVAGDVTLFSTTASDNATYGVDIGPDLGGFGAASLSVFGGTYESTMPGAQFGGIRAVEIAGETNLGPAFGPGGGGLTVSGHTGSGVFLDAGMRTEIEGGTFSSNGTGIDIIGYGEVEVEDASATLNTVNGLFIMGGGPATVTGGTYNANGAAGMHFDALPLVTVNKGSGLTADLNGTDGLFAMGFGELFVNGGSFSGNTTGLTATLGVNANFSQGVTATGNGTGAFIDDVAEGFIDRDGNYSSNDDHGLHLRDIGGVAVLTGTTANDNDADFDGVGDGVTTSKLLTPFSVGVDFVVEGGSFSDTDGPGGAAQQQNGISVLDVGGFVFMVPTNGPLAETTATGNRRDGVKLGETSGVTVIRGDYSDNAGHGLDLGALFGGMLDVHGVTADRNGARGLEATEASPAIISGKYV